VERDICPIAAVCTVQGWVFATAKNIFARTVEKTGKNHGKTGKNWQQV